MIRVRDDDDDDKSAEQQQHPEDEDQDEDADHQSFVTARASLSASSPRNNNENAEDLRSIVIRSSSNIPWYHRQWFGSDDPEEGAWQIKHLMLVEGPEFVRFAKFVLLSFAGIWIMYYVVRFLVRTVLCITIYVFIMSNCLTTHFPWLALSVDGLLHVLLLTNIHSSTTFVELGTRPNTTTA